MKYRILIVEDDPGIAAAIAQQIDLWDMESRRVTDFRDVLAEFGEFSPHLVLMDISLPFFDGYHWCREIRGISQAPVIFLSSAADNLNIIMAMNMGADDFIAKPFDLRVLMAKIQALLRRAYDFSAPAPVLEHRGAVLNPESDTFTYQGAAIPLSKNEYRILLTLLQNKGKTVSREKLMESIWQTDDFIDENTLTVNVNRLRKKLDAAGLPEYIETKFGVGYRIG